MNRGMVLALAAWLATPACGSSVGVSDGTGAAGGDEVAGGGGSGAGGGGVGGAEVESDRDRLWREICSCWNPLGEDYLECITKSPSNWACHYNVRTTESLQAEVSCGCEGKTDLGGSPCLDDWHAGQQPTEAFLAFQAACEAVPCNSHSLDCADWLPGFFIDEVYDHLAGCLIMSSCIDAPLCFNCEPWL